MTRDAPTVRFCTIADAAYFPGLVALVNSLRLQGHEEPVTVLDLGLTPAQRVELGGTCELVAAGHGARHPWLLAPRALLAAPADVCVYLDCDLVLTAPIHELLDDARAGLLCAFPDVLADRWFGEWRDRFGLPVEPRRQPYRNSGFVALAPAAFPGLLDRWAELCDTFVGEPVDERAVDHASPTGLFDQDALNALLMSEVPPERLAPCAPSRIAQGIEQLAATRVVDERALVCERAGHRMLLLHCFASPKPWDPSARGYLPDTAYVRCLRRLLVGPDLAVRTGALPAPWLAPGIRGELVLRLLAARTALRPRTRLRRLLAKRRPQTTAPGT